MAKEELIEMQGKVEEVLPDSRYRVTLENGHVMALYQKGETLKSGGIFSGEKLQLPDVRYGLAFVFRVFNKVSYALVLETSLPVQLQDSARTP